MKKTSEACSNWRKKELFGFITKLSCSKIFFEKFISNRNEKKKQQNTQIFRSMKKKQNYVPWIHSHINIHSHIHSFIATLKQKTFT